MSKDELPSIEDFNGGDSLPSIKDFIVEEKVEKLPSVENIIENNNLPSIEEIKEENDLPSVDDYIEEETATIEDAQGNTFAEVEDIIPPWPELLKIINDVREEIPDIPEIKYYDAELEKLCEIVDEVRSEIPEVKYYDAEVEAICEQIDLVRNTISELPEVKYYDEQINSIENKINLIKEDIINLPEPKYYDNDLQSIREDIEIVKKNFPWIEANFKGVEESLQNVNDSIGTVGEKIGLELDSILETVDVKVFENKVIINEVKDNFVKDKQQILADIKESSQKIFDLHNEFKDDDRKLKKQIQGEYNKLKQSVQEQLEKYNQESVKTDELLLKYFTDLKEEISKTPEVKYYDDDIDTLQESITKSNKRFLPIESDIKSLYKIVEDIKKTQQELNEQIINEPSEVNQDIGAGKDPLTPTDQKFATLDDLSKHYQLFVTRIQQQLSTIGGGGAGFIKDLADVEFDQTAGDGKLLIYDQANTKWVGIDSTALGGGGSVGAGGTWAVDSVGISTIKNVGIGTTAKDGYKLYVEGDARVTGILTVGPASVTIDGINNRVTSESFVGNLTGSASSVGGVSSSFLLDYSNFTNTPTIPDTSTLMPKSGGTFTGSVTINGGNYLQLKDNTNIIGHNGVINLLRFTDSTRISGDTMFFTTYNGVEYMRLSTSFGTQLKHQGITKLTVDSTGITVSGQLNDLTIPSGTGTIAITADIPTNNNELTNGAGYITSSGSITGTAAGLSGSPDISVGSITATSAEFSGNVTIGGTLTYEDVTNVDSIGIVTARSGVQIGPLSGIAATLSASGNANFSGIVTASGFVGNLTGSASSVGGVSSSFLLDYSNFTNTPTIPSDTGDLTNNAGFVTSGIVVGYATEGYVDTQVGLATVGLASEEFVGLSTVGLASEEFVGLATVGLASEEFVGLATVGLASEEFVGLATVGLASEEFVGLATAGLASETYVDTQVGLATAGLASETYVDTQVGLATAGLASETYVGLATVGLASETYVNNLVAISTFSGDYNDLTNQPTIPSDTGDLTNSVGFVTSGIVVGYATEGYVDTQVGLATAGLASETYVDTQVGLATAGLASETYVDTQVGLATAGLASEAFVGLATAGLASETYVDTQVGLATVGLLSQSGDGSNLTGIVTSISAGSGISIDQSTGNVTVTANGNFSHTTLIGTAASFSGNVTIGGTLTYEDVTNVDSIGLITARSGINVSGGEILVGSGFSVGQTGVVTATTFSGSGSLLTSIPNGALDNSSVSYGGVSLNLGETDATPAFDLSDATNYPFASLTGITTNIVGDTSPQLGGNLDLNSNNITGTGDIDFTGNLVVDTNTLFVNSTNNRIGIGTTNPAYQVEIENTGANALLVLDRTDGAACFIEGQDTRSAFGSVNETPLALAYNSLAVVTIGAGGSIRVNPDGDGYTFPTTDGSVNQVLQTDGEGNLSFANVSSGGIDAVVDDTTPQLGGNLDLNGNDINGTGNIDITGTLNVSGVSTFSGDANFQNVSVGGTLSLSGAGSQFFAYNEDTIKVKFANWYSSNDRQYGMGQLWFETWFAAIDNNPSQSLRDERRIGFYLEEPNNGSSDSGGTSNLHPTNDRMHIDINGVFVRDNFEVAGVSTFTGDITANGNIVGGISTFNTGIGTVHIGVGSTTLLVDGDARVLGILTVGRSSITLDGDNNRLLIGDEDVVISNSSIAIGDNVTINSSATGINSAPNVLYVAKDGNDSNNGTSIDNAKLTIAGAVGIATTGTIIKVLAGNYAENNPIEVPAFVSVVGDDLKTVTVTPNTANDDLFHVRKGCYLANMTFTNHVAPAAAVGFPTSEVATNVGGGKWESPYIQNCTSNTTTGTGLRIDGDQAESLKSIVVDSYTQYNQGGVGVAITNSGFAQLVSVFTICCNEAITCHKGSTCDLTNSNSSFGTFGLVSDGVSEQQFTGVVTATAAAAQDTVTIGITTTTRPYNGQVVYFGELFESVQTISVGSGGTGYTSTPTVTVDAPTGPSGETATAFATLEGESVTSITIISSGSQYQSTPNITISAPDVGINTATATANMSPIYYTINSSTPIVSGISTLTLDENLINSVGVGTTVYFFQQSKIVASSHTFEYVGSGNDITSATPLRGGVPVQANEVVTSNGGNVVYTSTDQSGNFRIGDDFEINQNTGTISGRAFSRSLFSEMTPFILALS